MEVMVAKVTRPLRVSRGKIVTTHLNCCRLIGQAESIFYDDFKSIRALACLTVGLLLKCLSLTAHLPEFTFSKGSGHYQTFPETLSFMYFYNADLILPLCV